MLARIKHVIPDSTKFEIFNIKEDEQVKFIIYSEKKLKDIINHCMKKIVLLNQNLTKPIRQDPTSAKVNKLDVDSFPTFRSILSTIDTLLYNLTKFLVPVLSHLTEEEFTVQDSFFVFKRNCWFKF